MVDIEYFKEELYKIVGVPKEMIIITDKNELINRSYDLNTCNINFLNWLYNVSKGND